MAHRGTMHGSTSPSLPPVEFRHPQFITPEQSIETPLTPIGLVDTKRLLKAVNATLNSAYKWPSRIDNEHHKLWPGAWYPDLPNERANPHVFRNDNINKIDLPSSFHAWVHKVTIPPAVPTLETMDLVGQAQDCISNMALAVKIGMQLMRNKMITNDQFTIRLSELFDQYNYGLDTLRQLPSEFHFINPEQFEVATVADMLIIRGELGRLAVKPTVATATRIIRQETIAAA